MCLRFSSGCVIFDLNERSNFHGILLCSHVTSFPSLPRNSGASCRKPLRSPAGQDSVTRN